MNAFTSTEAREACGRSLDLRAARAAKRRELRALPAKESQAKLALLLIDCPDEIANVPAHIALMWGRGIADWNARKLLALAEVHEVRSVAQLTERQRRLLARALGSEA